MDEGGNQINEPKDKMFMKIHKALNRRDYIDSVFVSNKEGGRGLVNIKNCIDASIKEHEEYIQNTTERQFKAARSTVCLSQ